MSTKDEIKAAFGLTDLAANELLAASEVLSRAFEALSRSYQTRLLTESKALIERSGEFNRQSPDSRSFLAKAKHATDRLSGDAKRMWSDQRNAMLAFNAFVEVCDAHQIRTPGGYEFTVTRTFEIRRNTSDFTMGTKAVVEGRDAFDTLNSNKYLQNSLSAQKYIKDLPFLKY